METMIRYLEKELPIRDFDGERRAKKDALEVIGTASIIQISYEEASSSLEDLIDKMIKSMFPPSAFQSPDLKKEVLSKLFQDECRLGNSIQGGCKNDNVSGTWTVSFVSLISIKRRFLCIATFEEAINLGPGMEKTLIFSLVCGPVDDKETKSGFETAVTLASLLTDSSFRRNLLAVGSSHDLHLLVSDRVAKLTEINNRNKHGDDVVISGESIKSSKVINFMSGVKENVIRRLGFYWSDITDGVNNVKSVEKTVSTSLFLFFLCILPTLAFGVLNSKNTKGKIDANRALVGEAIGGILFALFSGQPFVIIATTAPIALCNKIISDISEDMGVEFYSLYACVGLFNSLFLILYGVLGLNSLIKFSTRSVEEIFSMFIVVCFTADAWGDFLEDVSDHYYEENSKAVPLCFFLLKNATLIMGVFLFNVKFSRFFSSGVRETLSDYALPIAVILFSFVGSYAFGSIRVPVYPVDGVVDFKSSDLHGLDATSIGISAALGFTVSLLFFMDQGVSAQLVNSPVHHLKKGNANDYDFIVVAVINAFLSLFGLPWMHGLLPHSPLHVQALADYEERLVNGIPTRVITYVRETRLPAILSHVLIAVVVTSIPNVFSYIPVPVLDGLFLYCAVASLRGNSFHDRLQLLWTQQSKYPPNHYVRKCPQKKIHAFTFLQVAQLAILIFVGYAPWPFFRMVFPVFIALLIPFRHFVVPLIVGNKNANILDSFH
jgi:sodium borate transporter 11